MDSKEFRVDLSISNPKRTEDNIKLAKQLHRLNHAMPYTEEYDKALRKCMDRGRGNHSAWYKYREKCDCRSSFCRYKRCT